MIQKFTYSKEICSFCGMISFFIHPKLIPIYNIRFVAYCISVSPKPADQMIMYMNKTDASYLMVLMTLYIQILMEITSRATLRCYRHNYGFSKSLIANWGLKYIHNDEWYIRIDLKLIGLSIGVGMAQNTTTSEWRKYWQWCQSNFQPSSIIHLIKLASHYYEEWTVSSFETSKFIEFTILVIARLANNNNNSIW